MSDSTPRSDAQKRIRRLEAELDELKTHVAGLKKQRRGGPLMDALGLDTPTKRRQALKLAAGGASVSAILALASQQAEADAVGADWGTQADPWDKVWAHALAAGDGADALGFDSPLALNHNAISSATTITAAQVVPYDCSVSGFTITLGNELQQNGGWVVLIDQTGSAGTNTVTIDPEGSTNIDGASSITVEHNHAVTIAWWDGSEWRTTRFIDTVDARQASIGTLDNGGSNISLGDSLAPDADLAPIVKGTHVFLDLNENVTIADTNRVKLSDEQDEFSGLLILGQESDNHSAIVLLTEGVGAQIVDQNPSNWLTTTEDNQGTTNVYRSSAVLYLENEEAASKDYSWWTIGAGE